MTGNFYCVPSSCARVVYREYLPPTIRWRYEGENWNEIIGADDYSIEELPNLNSTQPYRVKGKSYFPWIYSYNSYGPSCTYRDWDQFKPGNENDSANNGVKTYFVIGPILGWRFANYQEASRACGNHWSSSSGLRNKLLSGYQNIEILCHGTASICNDIANRTAEPTWVTWFAGYRQYVSEGFEKIAFEPCENLPPTCKFTIYQNGEIVHEETRDTCPEVEKLDRRLSDVTKEITISKLPFLERVEVRNQDISTFFLPPLDTPFTEVNSLQEHSLNIYRTIVTSPPFLQETVPLPGAINPYVFIAQISSAPGCPPPQYTVICDCNDCESCPEGTCPVQCDGQICCYDTATGIAVKSIPIDEYCGDSL